MNPGKKLDGTGRLHVAFAPNSALSTHIHQHKVTMTRTLVMLVFAKRGRMLTASRAGGRMQLNEMYGTRAVRSLVADVPILRLGIEVIDARSGAGSFDLTATHLSSTFGTPGAADSP